MSCGGGEGRLQGKELSKWAVEVRLERQGGPIMEGFENQSGVKLDTI